MNKARLQGPGQGRARDTALMIGLLPGGHPKRQGQWPKGTHAFSLEFNSFQMQSLFTYYLYNLKCIFLKMPGFH